MDYDSDRWKHDSGDAGEVKSDLKLLISQEELASMEDSELKLFFDEVMQDIKGKAIKALCKNFKSDEYDLTLYRSIKLIVQSKV